MPRILVSILVIALVAPLAPGRGAGGAQAQQPPPSELVWQFAPNGVLADARIQQALFHLIDQDAVSAYASPIGGAATLSYAGGQYEGSQPDVELLLAAAGFDDPATQLVQTRPCRVWGVLGPDDDKQAIPYAVALGEELLQGLVTLGIAVQRCEGADDADAADILVWHKGQDYGYSPDEYFPDRDSFLAPVPSPPPALPNGPLSAPSTGDGGLKADNGSGPAAGVAALAGGLLLLAARGLYPRRR